MFQSDNKVKGLQCRSVIHCGFKKEEKKKSPLEGTKDPAHSGWECSRITSLSPSRPPPASLSIISVCHTLSCCADHCLWRSHNYREGCQRRFWNVWDNAVWQRQILRASPPLTRAPAALCFWAERSLAIRPQAHFVQLIHPRFKEERILNCVREKGDESWKRWKSYFLSLHRGGALGHP